MVLVLNIYGRQQKQRRIFFIVCDRQFTILDNMGKRKGSSQSMNIKIANGCASSNSAKAEDDNISKLQNLNQILIKEIKSLREEKTALTEYLVQMTLQVEAESKLKDMSKEAEKELRKELAKKESEHKAAISTAGTQLQEALHEIHVLSAESEATRKPWELEKGELLSRIEAEIKMKDNSKEAEKELREELAKKEKEHEAAISKTSTQLQKAQHEIQVISTESVATRKAWELEKDELLSHIADEIKMKDESKEAEEELRKELAKLEREHEAAISKAGIQLQEAHHEIQVISAESETTRKAWELEKDELLSQIASEMKMKDKSKEVEEELRKELAKLEREHEFAISKASTQLQEAQHEIQVLSAKSEATLEAWKLEKGELLSRIEAEIKMKDNSKEAEKELREEIAMKEREHEDAFSKAGTHLQEAEHEIQVISAESEATRKAWELEKDELLSQIAFEIKMKDKLKEAEKELRKELAKLEREHEFAISKASTQLQEAQHEIQVLSAKSEATLEAWKLEKGELLSRIEAEINMKDNSKEAEKELREELTKKEREYENAFSKVGTQLQEARHEIQVISAESEATRKAWDLEKDELLSQIAIEIKLKDKSKEAEKELRIEIAKLEKEHVAAQQEIQVISAESEAKRKAWELEKDELLLRIEAEIKMKYKSKEAEKELREDLAKLEREYEAATSKAGNQFHEAQHEIQVIAAELEATRKVWELEKDEFLSQIAAARKETETVTQQLLRKIEQNQHLWDAEKRKSRVTLAELQFKLQLMKTEKLLQSHIKENLSTTVLSLKDQLSECNAKLISMEGEKQTLKALSASNVEKMEAMLT